MTITPKDGTVFLLGASPEETEQFMAPRGYVMQFGAWRHPELPNRFVFVARADRLRGLRSPLVFCLPGHRSRPDAEEIEKVLVATKARLSLNCA
jgi:hypothetical protein